MLNLWNFRNTFTNKFLPFSYGYLNNNFTAQKTKKFDLTFAKTVHLSNIEIINYYRCFIDRPEFHSCVEIEENDWKYPFPHGYIPNYLSKISTNIAFKDKYGNLTDTIQEKMDIYLHQPSPYKINGKYFISINNKVINNIEYELPMNFRSTNDHNFTNDIQFEKFMNKINYYLKN